MDRKNQSDAIDMNEVSGIVKKYMNDACYADSVNAVKELIGKCLKSIDDIIDASGVKRRTREYLAGVCPDNADVEDVNELVQTYLHGVRSPMLVLKNENLLDDLALRMRIVDTVYKRAEELFAMYCVDTDTEPEFPVPVRKIASWLGLLVLQTTSKSCKPESDDYWTEGRLSRSSLRERKGVNPDLSAEVTGRVFIEPEMSEYDRRFLIALEIGRFVLRTEVVGPMWESSTYDGFIIGYSDPNEVLAAEFARALLLPRALLAQLKVEILDNNPLCGGNESKFIEKVMDKAQLPRSQATMGYEQFLRLMLVK